MKMYAETGFPVNRALVVGANHSGTGEYSS
jgi:hypothetical protein